MSSYCFVNGLFNGHGQNEVPHAIHELVDLLEDMSNQAIPDIDNTVVEVWNNLKQDNKDLMRFQSQLIKT